MSIVQNMLVAFSPPNSLDMNILDFGIWGDLEARAWENNP